MREYGEGHLKFMVEKKFHALIVDLCHVYKSKMHMCICYVNMIKTD